MMTIEEIESACGAAKELDFSRHDQSAPELTLRQIFYPLGFPTELRTNSPEVLAEAVQIWGMYSKRFDTELIKVDLCVVEDGVTECPPAPTYRLTYPHFVFIADGNNYAIFDFSHNRTQIVVSRAAVEHRSYLRYHFLGSAPGPHIATRFTTPVHAACVALEGRGVLLCGDSGAGKSTLSYACARAGWDYLSDDAAFLLHASSSYRIMTGNCYQVRFRPTAANLFPEIRGLEITPRAVGKPSVELPTTSLPSVKPVQSARVDFIVFLNRRSSSPLQLRPYRKDVCRYFMRQTIFGSPESLARQYAAIEDLLQVEIFEMRYSDLDWATDRLRTLVREGR